MMVTHTKKLGRHRTRPYREKNSSVKCRPCDVHKRDMSIRMLCGDYTIPSIMGRGTVVPTFQGTIQSKAPLLGQIMEGLPSKPTEINSLIEMMGQETLVAGCNRGDN